MNYKSTRSLNEEYVSAANAIKNGLAPDGGLYMLVAQAAAAVERFIEKTVSGKDIESVYNV